MNLSTPISIEKKIRFLKEGIDEMYNKVSTKSQKQNSQQILRIKFITFLDESVDAISLLSDNDSQAYKSIFPNPKQPASLEYKDKYYESQNQRILLQKKIIELKELKLKEKTNQLELQKMQAEHIKQNLELQRQIKQLNQKIVKLGNQNMFQKQKNKHLQQQIERLSVLNQKQNQVIQKSNLQRNRAEKLLYQMKQKYEGNQSLMPTGPKNQKFNYKNTQGLKNVRLFTNVCQQKKNHQRYFILQLPAKIQVQKIVYGIRIGVILPNKEIFYFNQLFLYQKDPIKLEIQGQNLAIQYLKRKQRTVLSKCKVVKPQVLVSLYGKGDSIIVDQTK